MLSRTKLEYTRRYNRRITDLTVIDPLEIPPMGDCHLAELKRLYGDKIVLKGNLHTTEVMLRGSVDDVIKASKQAIMRWEEGDLFFLSVINVVEILPMKT
jgi:hypothetical protein